MENKIITISEEELKNRTITITMEEFVTKFTKLAKELEEKDYEMGLAAMYICGSLGSMLFYGEEESQKAD